MNRKAHLLAVSLGALTVTLASACATTRTGGSSSPVVSSSPAALSGSATAPQLRLGYFANVTHASAVYGVGEGVFAKDLGSTQLKTQIF
ncbi:MAG: sulfonate transport system substrate-binding protein, partial [Actinomycetota bacterium]|nr:sulfonate transport system substrate-binding protein [Actinomycetota bacterium]